MDGFISVCRVEDLPEMGHVTKTIGEYSVLIAQLDDGIYSTENLCSHAQNELSRGRFRNGRISCPLHGVIFDFRTGQVMGGTLTSLGLRTFETRVEDGMVYVNATPNEQKVGILKR